MGFINFEVKPDGGDCGEASAPARMTVALAWIGARKARDRIFRSPLFQNPAWDILLDIYVHRGSGKESCVNDVCIASGAPATTVLRWVGVLVEEGLLERERDRSDRRRTILKLSPVGLRLIEETLDAATESDAKLGLGRLQIMP